MSAPALHVYFDFVDPLSYLLSLEIGARSLPAEWTGFELRPPPSPLTTTDDPLWAERWREARALAARARAELRPPRLVPWTRKAHELHVLAASHGLAEEIRRAVFEAYFAAGRDIGRVDVLVDLAVTLGLDRTETKAALDVDSLESAVAAARQDAAALGVAVVPTVRVGRRRVEGFPDPGWLGTLLPDR